MVSDGQGGTDRETVTITVRETNQAPVLALIGSQRVAEGEGLEFVLSATDADGDELTYSMEDAPAGATLYMSLVSFRVDDGWNPTLPALLTPALVTGDTVSGVSGTDLVMFSWWPGYAQSGTYRVTFVVSDGQGGTDRETVVITVEETNRAPVLASLGSQRVAEGEGLEFVVSATDADGDGLTYSMKDGPAGATLSDSTFSWWPGYAQSGTYRVTFVVSDGQGGTDREPVTITVRETNRAPVLASLGSQQVAEGERLRLVVSATDADGDRLTYSASNRPAGSSFSDGTFTWTPTNAQAGTYRVTFTVSDGRGGTDRETVTITVSEAVSVPKSDLVVSLPGGASMEFVWIEPGTFRMGSPSSEEGRQDDEGPVHEVELSRGFWLGKYEVTVGQFRHFVETTGYDAGDRCWTYENNDWEERSGRSWRNPGYSPLADHPVVCVNWEDVSAYAGWLSGETGVLHRLPTEAEWEYACRAGTTTRWSFGDEESQLGDYAWYHDNAWGVGKTHAQAVGGKLPNAWGLHDMHGNVFEWVQDWYSRSYNSSPRVDPPGPSTGSNRVIRGGDFYFDAWNLRSAGRNRSSPGDRYSGVGVRLVRLYNP